jgi:hypothetical protein
MLIVQIVNIQLLALSSHVWCVYGYLSAASWKHLFPDITQQRGSEQQVHVCTRHYDVIMHIR